MEDKDAGYVFDLSPLATHKWGNDDFYTVNGTTSQYKFQLKVRAHVWETSVSSSFKLY